MYIVIAIIAFGFLIFTHELGHFLAARAFNVKVLEFSLGMGPALLKKQRGETLYSLRALPIGGFCAMEGEDASSEDARAFSSQSAIKRAVILAAGAAMNFVTGFLLVLLVYSQAEAFSSPEITGFMDGCPYEGESMLMAGDEILRVDGHRICFSGNFSEYMAASGSDYHDITLKRGGERVKLENVYMPLREYESESGEKTMKYGIYFGSEKATVLSTVKYSWYSALDFVRVVWRGLTQLVTGAVGLRELAGPVGIVELVNDTASQEATVGAGLLDVAYLFALIAVNLAVMNMLPIPALDGGRVFFLLVTFIIEKLSRRKLNPKYEGWVHSAGFVLLMGLMVFVMFSDVFKIIASR